MKKRPNWWKNFSYFEKKYFTAKTEVFLTKKCFFPALARFNREFFFKKFTTFCCPDGIRPSVETVSVGLPPSLCLATTKGSLGGRNGFLMTFIVVVVSLVSKVLNNKICCSYFRRGKKSSKYIGYYLQKEQHFGAKTRARTMRNRLTGDLVVGWVHTSAFLRAFVQQASAFCSHWLRVRRIGTRVTRQWDYFYNIWPFVTIKMCPTMYKAGLKC